MNVGTHLEGSVNGGIWKSIKLEQTFWKSLTHFVFVLYLAWGECVTIGWWTRQSQFLCLLRAIPGNNPSSIPIVWGFHEQGGKTLPTTWDAFRFRWHDGYCLWQRTLFLEWIVSDSSIDWHMRCRHDVSWAHWAFSCWWIAVTFVDHLQINGVAGSKEDAVGWG